MASAADRPVVGTTCALTFVDGLVWATDPVVDTGRLSTSLAFRPDPIRVRRDGRHAGARLDTAVFSRLPDPSGLAYWIKKRRGGATLNTIAASMTASNEFKNTYGTLGNGQFVDLVYQNVLKRGPDPSGRAYWAKRLDNGFKRSAMMVQFSESNEFVTKSRQLMTAAIIWRLGHGSKSDAAIKAMAETYFYGVDYWGLLLEDAGFTSYPGSRSVRQPLRR